MKTEDLLDILGKIKEDNNESQDRYMLIDGLNLFFRNFSAINAVNPNGAHIGGLGGFFRSLGYLIKTIKPTHIYIPFDGMGSSDPRKNLISEYKGNRNHKRITNWDVFDNLEEEDNSKVNQMARVVQYLKQLPIKVTSIPKIEADDVISYMATELTDKTDNKVFIVSSDKDYLQLCNEQISVFRPIEKRFWTAVTIKEKLNIPPENFIIYKVLMGDNSDNLTGIKGLGEKKLYKLFPEITSRKITLENIFELSAERLTQHVIYARILQDEEALKVRYKVMDLSIPMLGEKEKTEIRELISQPTPQFKLANFIKLYNEDLLGNLIRDPNKWGLENFGNLK